MADESRHVPRWNHAYAMTAPATFETAKASHTPDEPSGPDAAHATGTRITPSINIVIAAATIVRPVPRKLPV